MTMWLGLLADTTQTVPTASMPIWETTIQWGFAGFCILLLAVIVWLIRKLLDVLARNNDVIVANTEAMTLLRAEFNKLGERYSEQEDVLKNLSTAILSRPCMVDWTVAPTPTKGTTQ